MSSVSDQIKTICLKHLGVSSTDDINTWFKTFYAGGYTVDGLDEAKEIIEKHMSSPVYICGDYDCDGVSATSILYLALRKFGLADVHFLIPHRHSEGYGLNLRMIKQIRSETSESPDVLLITVDNGITCFEPLAKAKEEYGWDVIVTDHHLPAKDEDGTILLPEADVIIDPMALEGTAVFSNYCGAELAYKLAAHLLGKQTSSILLPLASVAVFSDVMPLREENYVIARLGLKAMSQRKVLPGLNVLLASLKLDTVEDQDVLFKIAPALNAPGRLLDEGAKMCVELMITSNGARASYLAKQILDKNEQRKDETASAMDRCRPDASDPVIVSVLPSVNPGIVGLVAGRLSNDYGRPAVVLTQSSELGILTGSARSIPGVHILNCFMAAEKAFEKETGDKLFESCGGHEGAAGLTIAIDKVRPFTRILNDIVGPLMEDLPISEGVSYDAVISEKDIPEALQTQSLFAPFGEGNPQPVYLVQDFTPVYPDMPGFDCFREIGQDGLKITGSYGDALTFSGRSAFDDLSVGHPVPLVGTLNMNRFRGSETPQLMIQARADAAVTAEKKENEQEALA